MYRSNPAHSIPLVVGAAILGSMGLVGTVIALLGGRLQVQDFAAKACILVVSGGLALAAFRMVQIAFRDFYLEVSLDEEGLSWRKPFRSGQIRYDQIKNVSTTDISVSVSGVNGELLEFDPTLSNYSTFRETLLANYRRLRDQK
jgi:hypothetical protein